MADLQVKSQHSFDSNHKQWDESDDADPASLLACTVHTEKPGPPGPFKLVAQLSDSTAHACVLAAASLALCVVIQDLDKVPHTHRGHHLKQRHLQQAQ